MSFQAVLLPVFVQVGLTLFIAFWLGLERRHQLKCGKVEHSAIALSTSGWAPRLRQISNCFSNQFELPVLFYVVVVLAVETHGANLTFVILEWLFVATRIWHAVIHTTSNDVAKRRRAFSVGVLFLLAMWLVFAVRLFVYPVAA
jgi:hypothetical protein